MSEFPPLPPVTSRFGKWPSGFQAAILIGAGIILGFGGCATFLSNIMTSSSASGVLVIVGGGAFFVGLVMALAGLVEALIVLFRAVSGKK